jgi:protein-tyrosine phosphatase
LPDDLAGLKAAGVDVLVSLLEPVEAVELGLAEEGQRCAEAGIEFVVLPVEDRGVPERAREFLAVAERLLTQIDAGRAVGIHCRAGIGRSSLLAAAILVLSGASPDDAWMRVSKARGIAVPDTAEQRRWLDSTVPGTRP